jgi:hypothetical protein
MCPVIAAPPPVCAAIGAHCARANAVANANAIKTLPEINFIVNVSFSSPSEDW